MLKEFKAFIARGNVLDLAVGLILATYVGAIVKSLVDDILMPVFGKLMLGVDLSRLSFVISSAEYNTSNELISPEVSIRYGTFINHTVTFVFIAIFVFIIVKSYNRMKRKKEESSEKLEPTADQELLMEIRDLLKKNVGS